MGGQHCRQCRLRAGGQASADASATLPAPTMWVPNASAALPAPTVWVPNASATPPGGVAPGCCGSGAPTQRAHKRRCACGHEMHFPVPIFLLLAGSASPPCWAGGPPPQSHSRPGCRDSRTRGQRMPPKLPPSCPHRCGNTLAATSRLGACCTARCATVRSQALQKALQSGARRRTPRTSTQQQQHKTRALHVWSKHR